MKDPKREQIFRKKDIPISNLLTRTTTFSKVTLDIVIECRHA